MKAHTLRKIKEYNSYLHEKNQIRITIIKYKPDKIKDLN